MVGTLDNIADIFTKHTGAGTSTVLAYTASTKVHNSKSTTGATCPLDTSDTSATLAWR